MENLEDVKTGDKVIFCNGWDESVVTVTKVTKTQIHTGYSKYRKCDGRAVGADTWDRAMIKPYTEEAEKRIKIENNKRIMASYFKGYKFNLLAYEDMVKVYNLLKELEKK